MRYFFPAVATLLTFFFSFVASYIFFGDKSMQVKVHLYYEVITNLFCRYLSNIFYSIFSFVEVPTSIELKIPHWWPAQYKRRNQHAGNRLWDSPPHSNISFIISGDSPLVTLYISVGIAWIFLWCLKTELLFSSSCSKMVLFLSINSAHLVCLFYCLTYNCGTSK